MTHPLYHDNTKIVESEKQFRRWCHTSTGKRRYALMAHARGASNGRVEHLKREVHQMTNTIGQPSEMARIEMMLTAVLSIAPQQLTSWVYGWVGGRSSEDVPFIILYPKADNQFLNNYVVKVYKEDFNRLPPYIDTNNVPNDTAASPQKNAAIKQGIYRHCRPFQVVMKLGGELDNGQRRKKLVGVLRYGKETAVNQQPAAQRPEPVKTAVNGHKVADIRLTISDGGLVTTIGLVADRAAQTGKFKNAHEALTAAKKWGGWENAPDDYKVEMKTKIRQENAVRLFDWLVNEEA